MPKMKGWEDYIPASGEASVGLNLKGRYGRSSNVRRFKGRRSRFSNNRRTNRWWVTSANNEEGWTPVSVAGDNGKSYQLYEILPMNTAVAPVSNQLQAQRLNKPCKLLMNQGFIWMRMEMPDPPSQGWLNSGARLPLIAWWNWVVKRGGWENNVPTPDSFNMLPTLSPSSDLRRALQSKRIISYGATAIYPQTGFMPVFNTAIEEFTVGSTLSPAERFPFARIPLPRIPKKGITFGPDDVLAFNCGFTTANLGPLDASAFIVEMYAGHVRSLFADAG